MYIDTYLAIPLWIFAIFGLFHFMLHIFAALDVHRKNKPRAQTLIISARNQEDVIGGMVRSLMLKARLSAAEEKMLQVILLDMGSDDDTYRIMEILSRNYSMIKLVKPEI